MVTRSASAAALPPPGGFDPPEGGGSWGAWRPKNRGINDALGPVVRDTDGRVFTLSTLNSMLEVAPFPGLVALP